MNAWKVLSPGVLTTVQDRGRTGARHYGVAQAGALDPRAASLANRLVGNDDDAAVLELTLRGPTLRLPRGARIALVGAEVAAMHDGHPLPGQRPVQLPAGDLALGALGAGMRAWLAVHGGFTLPSAMGSRSTDLRGGFGGVSGRALQAGDRLPVGATRALPAHAPMRTTTWWIGRDVYSPSDAVRFVPAPGFDPTDFCARAWRVDPRSNRQGLRLGGEALAPRAHHGLSEPIAIGTLQLPPDGQPIVLLADAQTVGGYPRLGHVIAADLPRLAQAMPGEWLAFEAVDLATARRLDLREAHRHARACLAIDQHLARAPA